MPSEPQPSAVLIDFADPEQVRAWSPVDDVVMGGSSGSALVPGERCAVFTGELRPQDGAGFASVRSAELALDLSSRTGLELCVRGDGRAYELRLRDDLDPAAPSHAAALAAPAERWTQLRLPFAAFHAIHRGRPIPDAPPLDRARVRSLTLLLSDGRRGPFRLEVAWIRAYAQP